MIERINEYVVNPLIYLLIGVAVLAFLWGVIEFLVNADDPGKRADGQRHLLWGIVGLGIIFGVYGIINVIKDTILATFD